MISFPISSLNPVKLNNHKLGIGRAFLNLLSSEDILPSDYSLSPILLGGVVRDSVFREREPNDIDIFFYRNLETIRSLGSSTSRSRVDMDLSRLQENLLVWLEDIGLEYESLLVENNGQYPNSAGRFLDILSFEWSGATIQVMIPLNYMNTAHSVSNLLASMPLICGVGMTKNFIYTTNAFAGALNMLGSGVHPVAHDRDVAYITKKFGENALIRRYDGSEQLVQDGLSAIFGEFAVVTAGSVTNRDNMPRVTQTELIRRYYVSLFGDIEFTSGTSAAMPEDY